MINSFFEMVAGGNPVDNASLFDDLSPISLVDAAAPPCLILQGHYDLLPLSEAQDLQTQIQSFGRPAILVEFPYQGHAFDLVFNAPGGQVSTYYIERFLAATQYIPV